ncbi:MAG: glycosyltransferase, partial [Mesorhizobium sp.]|nr:glycosyltransferase [Mesorhizobium sp.]
MLTVVIETRNEEEALARTLASLVGGSVEGVVREVMVHDRGSTDHTVLVADHA